MFASKVTITEETKEKTNLPAAKKGELRFNKLKELDKDGKLAFIKTRRELALACGYPEEQINNGIAWVFRLINCGYLSEVTTGYVNGQYEKEFHLTGKQPDFEYRGVKKANHKTIKGRIRAPKEEPKVEPTTEVKVEHTNTANELTITRGDLTIKATLDSDKIAEVIKELFK